MKPLTCALLCVLLMVCEGKNRTTLDEMMNVCLDGSYHKLRASPELGLHGYCSQWSGLSCCTQNTTWDLNLAGKKTYNFGYDHCQGHNMSDKCKRHFLSDLCFYECSPNVMPWTVEFNGKIRSERNVDVPLCGSDCDAWWEDCKEEFTCVDNWGKKFNWTTDGNVCPQNSTCRKFDEVFGNATNFCEVIWNSAWKVVADDKPCMKMNFTGDNPNRQVAETYAKEKLGITSSGETFKLAIFPSFVSILLAQFYFYL